MLFEFQQANGTWAELTLPVLIMAACVLATWILIRHTTTGRQLYAFGDNPEGARRLGINIAAMHFIAFGWLGLMAGIGGLVQVHYAQEVVPNALIGRELDVLAAVVLGGARLGGGSGTVLGCILGVFLVSVTQNGLNLLGISPYAFKMIVGAIILVAISLSSDRLGAHAGRSAADGRPWLRPAQGGERAARDRLARPGRKARPRDHRARRCADRGHGRSSASLRPRFLTNATFDSVAFQLPELGLLTLAMLMPIISGGINLASHLHRQHLRADPRLGAACQRRARTPGSSAFLLGSVLAIGVGTAERARDGAGHRLSPARIRSWFRSR